MMHAPRPQNRDDGFISSFQNPPILQNVPLGSHPHIDPDKLEVVVYLSPTNLLFIFKKTKSG